MIRSRKKMMIVAFEIIIDVVFRIAIVVAVAVNCKDLTLSPVVRIIIVGIIVGRQRDNSIFSLFVSKKYSYSFVVVVRSVSIVDSKSFDGSSNASYSFFSGSKASFFPAGSGIISPFLFKNT